MKDHYGNPVIAYTACPKCQRLTRTNQECCGPKIPGKKAWDSVKYTNDRILALQSQADRGSLRASSR